MHQRACDCNALHLAAGELKRERGGAIGETHPFKALASDLLGLLSGFKRFGTQEGALPVSKTDKSFHRTAAIAHLLVARERVLELVDRPRVFAGRRVALRA